MRSGKRHMTEEMELLNEKKKKKKKIRALGEKETEIFGGIGSGNHQKVKMK